HRAPRLLQSDRAGPGQAARDRPRANGLLGQERRPGVRARRAADQAVSELRGRLTRLESRGRVAGKAADAVSANGSKRVTLGRIGGLFGVKGWVKVLSYTEPRENIVGYAEWILEHDGALYRVAVEAGQRAGKHVVA